MILGVYATRSFRDDYHVDSVVFGTCMRLDLLLMICQGMSWQHLHDAGCISLCGWKAQRPNAAVVSCECDAHGGLLKTALLHQRLRLSCLYMPTWHSQYSLI